MQQGLNKKFHQQLTKIKLLITDVDGVLTNGSVYVGSDGTEPMVQFNIYDGLATVFADDCGLKIAVLSGRKSLCVEARHQKLGLSLIYTGIENKLAKLEEIAAELGLDFSEIAYIGDDVIDLRVIKAVGFSACPQSAMPIVKEKVDLVLQTSGGHGALREVVEMILQAQGLLQDYINNSYL